MAKPVAAARLEFALLASWIRCTRSWASRGIEGSWGQRRPAKLGDGRGIGRKTLTPVVDFAERLMQLCRALTGAAAKGAARDAAGGCRARHGGTGAWRIRECGGCWIEAMCEFRRSSGSVPLEVSPERFVEFARSPSRTQISAAAGMSGGGVHSIRQHRCSPSFLPRRLDQIGVCVSPACSGAMVRWWGSHAGIPLAADGLPSADVSRRTSPYYRSASETDDGFGHPACVSAPASVGCGGGQYHCTRLLANQSGRMMLHADPSTVEVALCRG